MNMNEKEIIKKVNEERQTVKAYSDKAIPADQWNDIIDTVQWAPSSHGYEPYRVLIINRANPLRQEILPAMWGQGTVLEADKLMIFLSLKRKVWRSEKYIEERTRRSLTEVRGMKPGKEFDEALKKGMKMAMDAMDEKEPTDEWSMKQTYIALGMAMYAATIYGIGTTAMEGFSRITLDPILKKHKLMTDDEEVSVVLAFGYPKSKTAYAHWGTGKRVRNPKSQKFTTV